MNIEKFLKKENQKGSQLTAKWMIIILDLLWIGSLFLWVMYLYGLGFLSAGNMGVLALVLVSYFSFPVAVVYTLSTSFRFFKLKEYQRGMRVSCLPFIWILSYFLIGILISLSK